MNRDNPMLIAALEVSTIVERAKPDKINDALVALRPYNIQLKVLAVRMLQMRLGESVFYCEEFVNLSRVHRSAFVASDA